MAVSLYEILLTLRTRGLISVLENPALLRADPHEMPLSSLATDVGIFAVHTILGRSLIQSVVAVNPLLHESGHERAANF